MDLVDTTDSNDECEFGLIWHVEIAILLSIAFQTKLLPLSLTVLSYVLLGPLEDLSSFLLILLEISCIFISLTKEQ